MKPSTKLNLWLLSLTSISAFTIWVNLSKLMSENEVMSDLIHAHRTLAVALSLTKNRENIIGIFSVAQGGALPNNALKFALPILGLAFEVAKHIPQPKIRAI